MEQGIELHAAKIMTVGERAEDVFYVTDLENRALDAGASQALRDRMKEALDRRQAL
jgi:[protein-PII] uridylyltransferase